MNSKRREDDVLNVLLGLTESLKRKLGRPRSKMNFACPEKFNATIERFS